MKTIRRLKNILRSNTNALLEKAENPEKILKQSVLDMQENLRQAKLQIAAALSAEKKLERMLHTHEQQAERLRGTAAASARDGRDDEARESLRFRIAHLEQAEALKEQLSRQKEGTALLKQALGVLEDKVFEARRQRELLTARRKLAEAKRGIHESISGIAEKNAFADMTAFEAFEGVRDGVLSAETDADAAAEMSTLCAKDIIDATRGEWALTLQEPKVEEELKRIKEQIEGEPSEKR